ncbi:MAG TPA: hypothetical protein VLM85_02525 [Polyangiaceae bacterium]|nr:hypothetical protein [Polyangiaceae bacterium]
MTQLGDAHNFGRHVVLRGRRIHKPRPLLWEWLVLSRASPLRKLLGAGFDFLPALRFYERDEVETLRLAPIRSRSARTRREVASITGRSLALWSWLGVSDLHWENLVLGVDARARIVFGPLDVEMILADLALPTYTKLIADADPEYAEMCRHAAGVRRVLPILGKPIAAPELLATVGAYRDALEFLDRHAGEIAATFLSLPALRTTPIRVLLRATADYVRARTEPVWPPLLDAESVQLARGDIPYFFRLYGERGIHFYEDARLEKRGRLPLRGDVPKLEPLLDLERGLRSPSRKKLREQGLFAVIGAFDHPSLDGRHEDGGLAIDLRKRTVVVERAGETLEAPRDLSRVVGSAYLPCSCGEIQ